MLTVQTYCLMFYEFHYNNVFFSASYTPHALFCLLVCIAREQIIYATALNLIPKFVLQKHFILAIIVAKVLFHYLAVSTWQNAMALPDWTRYWWISPVIQSYSYIAVRAYTQSIGAKVWKLLNTCDGQWINMHFNYSRITSENRPQQK